MRLRVVGILVSVLAETAAAQNPPAPDFAQMTRLFGTWVADAGSGGQPGRAIRGGETWTSDLDRRVIVRRDYSEYSATSERAAFRHDGMMIIAPGAHGFSAHAYDNEGHVIDYTIVATDSTIVFTSERPASSPQFRLTYRRTSDGYAELFEIAPPNDPERYRSYVSGRIRKAP
jgi:hypothetical protein